MKRAISQFMALLLLSLPSFAQKPVRVACVGDSITYGDKIENRETDSYPAVLQRLAGDQSIVGNFGVNGATALPIPCRSWRDTPACREALEFQPDCVVIMLGINDLAFPEQAGRYPQALKEIAALFQALPASPKIFLCTLTPIAPAMPQWQVNQTIRQQSNPAIRSVAQETGAGIIDISAVFPCTMEALPDGLHPSPNGAALIARTVFDTIGNTSSPDIAIQPAPVSGTVDLSIRREALAARARTGYWLKRQNHLPEIPPPEPARPMEAFLPLLEGGNAPDGMPPAEACAALAAALAAAGEETVFPAPDRPVAWRNAMLHQLVQRQKIDPRGGGYWSFPQAESDPEEPLRSTLRILQALDLALGE